MTQTTEQERAEFEAWADSEFYDGIASVGDTWSDARNMYTDAAHHMAFYAWKAARRAPAVPHHTMKLIKQALECAVARLAQAQTKPNLVSTLEWNALQEICKTLAAAPQPPEAAPVECACGDSYPADSFGAGFIAASGKCPNCDAAEAAPVQLPEPETTVHSKLGTTCMFPSSNMRKGDKIYTEHQVRQLLAAHGIGTKMQSPS